MFTRRLSPMLLVPADPAERAGYIHEQKWDGVRCIAQVEGGAWRLRLRGTTADPACFPELERLSALPPWTALDAELVVLDAAGRPHFGSALSRIGSADPLRAGIAAGIRPVTLMCFDVLWLAGEDMTGLPVELRKERLAEALAAAAEPRVRAVEWVVGRGDAVYSQAARLGLEGVVAKRLGSSYLCGRRSRSWLKIKVPGYKRPPAAG